jgi:Uma2 family endonuclease
MAIHVEVTRRRFTIDEYHRMAEAGILHENDRVELIEGEIVQTTLIGRRHAACVAEFTRLLVPAVGPRALLFDPQRMDTNTSSASDAVASCPRTRSRTSYYPSTRSFFLGNSSRWSTGAKHTLRSPKT